MTRTPLARSIGQFLGHIVAAVRSDPRTTVQRQTTVEQEDRGSVVLRRTTIEEIELKDGAVLNSSQNLNPCSEE